VKSLLQIQTSLKRAVDTTIIPLLLMKMELRGEIVQMKMMMTTLGVRISSRLPLLRGSKSSRTY
jgi:hypothetical protein